MQNFWEGGPEAVSARPDRQRFQLPKAPTVTRGCALPPHAYHGMRFFRLHAYHGMSRAARLLPSLTHGKTHAHKQSLCG